MESDFFQRPHRSVKIKNVQAMRRADFLIPVEDSLVPPYNHGDILMIQKQPDVFEGEIGLFLINGKPHVKRRGKDVLLSLNDSIRPIPITGDIHGIGKVVGVLDPACVDENFLEILEIGINK